MPPRDVCGREWPRRTISEEEQHVWQQATAEVRPLGGTPRPLPAPPAPPLIRRPSHPLVSVPASYAAPPREVCASPEGRLDPQLKRRLRRGALTPQARLDLHGMNQEVAFQHFTTFIEACYHADQRFVLVITGKGVGGQGKLRKNFERWLEVSPLRHMVQAFESAQARDGGAGAFYVKLRRVRE